MVYLFFRTLVTKVRQVLLNCLNLIIGCQLGKCLNTACGADISLTTVEHVTHVCITSLHVSGHVARLGGLTGAVKLLNMAKKQEQVSGQQH